eukprot:XP_027327348.1 uncharacterized protein LOC113845549 [Anas platyrhynchos]
MRTGVRRLCSLRGGMGSTSTAAAWDGGTHWAQRLFPDPPSLVTAASSTQLRALRTLQPQQVPIPSGHADGHGHPFPVLHLHTQEMLWRRKPLPCSPRPPEKPPGCRCPGLILSPQVCWVQQRASMLSWASTKPQHEASDLAAHSYRLGKQLGGQILLLFPLRCPWGSGSPHHPQCAPPGLCSIGDHLPSASCCQLLDFVAVIQEAKASSLPASIPPGRSPPFPQDRLCPSHAVCPGTAGPGTTAACLPPRPAQHHEVGAQGVPDPHGHNWHQGGPTRGCPPSQCLSQHPPSASARARLWEGDLCLPRAATEAVPMGTVPMGTHEVWPWGGSAPASGSALLGEDP